MSKPLIQIGNDVREMTDLEYAQWQTDNEAHAAREAAAKAQAEARVSALAKLSALGLDDDEIAALVG